MESFRSLVEAVLFKMITIETDTPSFLASKIAKRYAEEIERVEENYRVKEYAE